MYYLCTSEEERALNKGLSLLFGTLGMSIV